MLIEREQKVCSQENLLSVFLFCLLEVFIIISFTTEALQTSIVEARGVVVKASAPRSRGHGFDSRRAGHV